MPRSPILPNPAFPDEGLSNRLTQAPSRDPGSSHINGVLTKGTRFRSETSEPKTERGSGFPWLMEPFQTGTKAELRSQNLKAFEPLRFHPRAIQCTAHDSKNNHLEKQSKTQLNQEVNGGSWNGSARIPTILSQGPASKERKNIKRRARGEHSSKGSADLSKGLARWKLHERHD